VGSRAGAPTYLRIAELSPSLKPLSLALSGSALIPADCQTKLNTSGDNRRTVVVDRFVCVQLHRFEIRKTGQTMMLTMNE
jgi:hypothetical protein